MKLFGKFKTMFGHPVAKVQRVRIVEKSYAEQSVEEREINRVFDEIVGRRMAAVPVCSFYPPPPVNLLPKRNPCKIEWFSEDKTRLNTPSGAEVRIQQLLLQYDIELYAEVCFNDLRLPSGGFARYDFFIPEYSIVIEYDGARYHNSVERITIDNLKTEFCRINDLTLMRYNINHWKKLDDYIDMLMKDYNIPLIK